MKRRGACERGGACEAERRVRKRGRVRNKGACKRGGACEAEREGSGACAKRGVVFGEARVRKRSVPGKQKSPWRMAFVSVGLTSIVVDERTCHTPPFVPQLATTKMSDVGVITSQPLSIGGGCTIDLTWMPMPPVAAQPAIGTGAGFWPTPLVAIAPVVVRRPTALAEATRPSARTMESCMVVGAFALLSFWGGDKAWEKCGKGGVEMGENAVR